MPPIQRGPFHGRGAMPSFMNNRMGRGLFGGAQQMNPRGMQQAGGLFRGPQQTKQGGGLLSRLLGGGGKTSGVAGMNPVGRTAGTGGGGGSFLQSLSNPSAISGFLNNTQQVLKTAQSLGPMIQQYGPLVKNLPAMWKLFRGLKDAPDASEEEKKDESTDETKDESKDESKDEKKDNTIKNSKQIETEEKEEIEKGISMPKLYI
ncbi:hypothetical protein H1Z61_01535 [Bacillus aquiflavi]|uniref:YqfQ-like protein n=1 Tax=Bacillus aquiflavi TaxID=2672567 RepID=A0A6B3VXG9_9BACI|nr:VrrA/YqfQ family protein [Bacillus aquiflavi]MBA4535851.1 hypothetical protein [Bacillus aquiflavi]NEY80226.1 hypothetical protein [Bacillus aquiflavi]UAC47276.1 YqfQ family protein [Bacillus aquiflavi]